MTVEELIRLAEEAGFVEISVKSIPNYGRRIYSVIMFSDRKVTGTEKVMEVGSTLQEVLDVAGKRFEKKEEQEEEQADA